MDVVLKLMETAWPFDQPENCAVTSLRQIMQSDTPVLLVTHDDEDHGWQFLAGGDAPNMDDVVLVLFRNVIAKDVTLYDLAGAARLAGAAPVRWRPMGTRKVCALAARLMSFNMSANTAPQQQEAASPQAMLSGCLLR